MAAESLAHQDAATSWRQWHLPLSEGAVTLREGLRSLSQLGAEQPAIPLIVQMLENPRFRLPLFQLFPGAVELYRHDCIHLLLGRGLLPLDEAFAIGFTMGSTRRLGHWRARLFCWCSEHLYPPVYRFGSAGCRVFLDAVHLARVSRCRALHLVDFDGMLDWSLSTIRQHMGLETELLRAYYALEKQRNPASPESLRLLDGPCLRLGQHNMPIDHLQS